MSYFRHAPVYPVAVPVPVASHSYAYGAPPYSHMNPSPAYGPSYGPSYDQSYGPSQSYPPPPPPPQPQPQTTQFPTVYQPTSQSTLTPPPQAINKYEPIKTQLAFQNKWSSDLCDCCEDCKSCCFAFWCFPCFLCKLDGVAGECPCTTFCSAVFTGHCTGIGLLRSKIRGAYKIHGTICEDCCCSVCCPCCVALQIYRELDFRGEND